jgi:NRAMP (natural resistance-associated macrophage protein)-like metal ion transporter
MKSLWQRFKKSLGPGVITGIADDDPSGIATYAQTGAVFGLSQLWLALFTYPFMIAIQEMCGRIGMITGKGLASILKENYSRPILYGAVTLLLITNTINIGADLGAMAASLQLITPLSFTVALSFLTFITVASIILIPYQKYVAVLKYLALTICAYVITAFTLNQSWGTIFSALIIPHFEWSDVYILNITAMLGTTISPYLFFWQASEEVEEEIVGGKIQDLDTTIPEVTSSELSQMRIDTATGMFVSNLVTFFIIITAASTLGASGLTSITSAAQVAESLRPLAGNFAFLLFAIGIIGTGLLAVPVLAGSASYAISETFGWKEGLGKTFTQARGFYIIIIFSLIIGMAVNIIDINPITMLYYSAILNGLLAPPLMILILLIGNNKKILKNHTNGKLGNILGISITTIMSALTIYFLYSLF